MTTNHSIEKLSKVPREGLILSIPTATTIGSVSFVLSIFGFGFSRILWPGIPVLAFAAPVIVVAVAITIIVRNARRLRRRDNQLADFAFAHGYRINAFHPKPREFFAANGSLDELQDGQDLTVRNVIETAEWTYYDLSYALYTRTKYGKHKSSTVYYGVMSTKLPRKLPNVFFDSRQARGRQFRFHFARSQRHSLEGDFDKFFVTYFPEAYKIDSLSFISPDVMWQLREAADYDIEIADDRLFLYGPLFAPEAQLTDMAAKLAAIKKELLDNILTYRDERLPLRHGRNKVAPEGMKLKRGNFWLIVFISIIVVHIAVKIFFAIR